jgi:hypothetical protein
MSKDPLALAIAESLGASRNPVKPANKLRGAAYRDSAIEFSKLYPAGSTLTWDQLLQFALSQNLIDVGSLPTEEDAADKQSNSWLAHLQRRHQVRSKLNKASSHPAMIPYGGAFTIEPSGGGLVVRTAAQAIAASDAPTRIASLATSKRQKLEYLIQSTDWSQLPPHERGLAEAVRRDIDDWVEVVNLQAKQLERKFIDLGHHLNKLVAIGEVQSRNGGIKGLLSNGSDDDTEE